MRGGHRLPYAFCSRGSRGGGPERGRAYPGGVRRTSLAARQARPCTRSGRARRAGRDPAAAAGAPRAPRGAVVHRPLATVARRVPRGVVRSGGNFMVPLSRRLQAPLRRLGRVGAADGPSPGG